MKLTDDNRQVYAGSEFDLWAHRSELEPGERFLIERYLEKDRRTFEAGCGGGRLLLDLQAHGFSDLHGFDYLQQFIDVARDRDQRHSISYTVQSMVALDYATDSFDQAIYLQQVLCFLESEEDRRRAVREAFRVLRPGATLVGSFLAYRQRAESWAYRSTMTYLSGLRWLLGRPISKQYWPWLRHGKAFNFAALLDRGPYTYWMREREATELFAEAGFTIVAVGSDEQVEQRQFFNSVDALEAAPFHGRLYLVCQKPAPPAG